jgi:hypothetical protein
MEGRAEPPPAAATLGWELLAVDPDAGTIEVAFRASEAFPAGRLPEHEAGHQHIWSSDTEEAPFVAVAALSSS